jgi:hypothetical protein
MDVIATLINRREHFSRRGFCTGPIDLARHIDWISACLRLVVCVLFVVSHCYSGSVSKLFYVQVWLRNGGAVSRC